MIWKGAEWLELSGPAPFESDCEFTTDPSDRKDTSGYEELKTIILETIINVHKIKKQEISRLHEKVWYWICELALWIKQVMWIKQGMTELFNKRINEWSMKMRFSFSSFPVLFYVHLQWLTNDNRERCGTHFLIVNNKKWNEKPVFFPLTHSVVRCFIDSFPLLIDPWHNFVSLIRIY